LTLYDPDERKKDEKLGDEQLREGREPYKGGNSNRRKREKISIWKNRQFRIEGS